MAIFTADSLGPSDDRTLFHYTSQAGLEGILRTSSIWATNIRYLNDAAEFKHTVGLFKDHISSRRDLDSHSKLLLEVLHDDAFGRPWHEHVPLSLYVASFSREADQLSQWRAYAPSNGYCVGFAPSVLKQTAGYELIECVYGREEQELRAAQVVASKALAPQAEDQKHGAMSEPDRDTVLRTIEDFERTVAEFRSNNVVLSTTVLLRRKQNGGSYRRCSGARKLINGKAM